MTEQNPVDSTREVPTTSPAASAEPSPTAPAANPPRWRGRKTAIAAALAIGLSSGGAVAAASVIDQGTSGSDRPGPGGGQGFPGGGQPGKQQQQPPSNQQMPQPPSGGQGGQQPPSQSDTDPT